MIQTNSATPANIASGLFRQLSSSAATHLDSEQRWVIDLSPSLNSIVYEWIPKETNGRLFVIHDGHSDDTYNCDGTISIRAIHNTASYATVNRLLTLGFTILWILMPLLRRQSDVFSRRALSEQHTLSKRQHGRSN